MSEITIFLNNLYIVLGAVFVYMTAFFLTAAVIKRNDLADTAWGLGFILVTYLSLYLSDNLNIVQYVLAGLVTLWGLRLAIHIFSRNRGKGEDYRYKAWREEWGKWWLVRSYLQVFLLQGLLLVVIASPIVLSSAVTPNLSWLTYIGVAIWLFGFYFEAVGDYQLRQFIKDPNNKGKIMNQGLWRYTRHPNYFGEVTMWWGIWLIAFVAPWGWFAIIGPLTITFLILKVSGIPMLEAKYVGNQDYEEYKRKTSKFFPLPPKKLD